MYTVQMISLYFIFKMPQTLPLIILSCFSYINKVDRQMEDLEASFNAVSFLSAKSLLFNFILQLFWLFWEIVLYLIVLYLIVLMV